MKIITISNMYPSQKDPSFGTFVQVFYENLSRLNKGGVNDLIAIKGRGGVKLIKYVIFYIKVLYTLFFIKYDIVYVHTITFPIVPIWIVSLFKKLPLVFNVHGTDLLGNSSILKFFRRIGWRLVLNSKLIVSPSNFFAKKIIDFYSLKDINQVYVSPSGGVDKTIFRERDTVRQDAFIAGYVSRIDKGKGWDLFVKSIYKLKQIGVNIRGVIVGKGAQVEELCNMINDYNLKDSIIYYGGVSHDKLPGIYSSFDVFCNCSQLEESLGLVTLEAMACGVPVIGSHKGAIVECVKNGYNGFLFKEGDEEDLKDRILNYIELSDEQKAIMKRNSVLFSNNFDTYRVMSEIYYKLESLI